MKIEIGTFTRLAFSCAGRMGNESTIFVKMLALKMSLKRGETWIRRKISFIKLRKLRSCILEKFYTGIFILTNFIAFSSLEVLWQVKLEQTVT